jgi:hypothetical protein
MGDEKQSQIGGAYPLPQPGRSERHEDDEGRKHCDYRRGRDSRQKPGSNSGGSGDKP